MPLSIGDTTAIAVDVGAAVSFDNSALTVPMTYRVRADVAMHVLVGASPTATTEHLYLPPNAEMILAVPVGQDISLLGVEEGTAFVTAVKEIAGRGRRGNIQNETPPGQTQIVPVNEVLPVITGTASRGSTLTRSTGTWTDNPDSYATQWTRDGVDIGGATGATYDVTIDDLAALIRVRVTATNEEGSASATSAPTAAVVSSPYNSVQPVANGDDTANESTETHIYTVTEGTWLGTPTITVTYQWYRGASPIGGATSNSYELVTADVGAVVTCAVTATNTQGGSSIQVGLAGNPVVVAVAAPTPGQDGGDQTSAGVTSDNVTMPGDVTAGDQIFVSFSIYQGSGARSVTSVTDNKGNTYTQVGSHEAGSTKARVEIWTAKAVVGGSSFIVTVNYSAGTFAAWGVLETSPVNINAINVIDQANGTADPAVFTTEPVGSSAKALLIANFAIQGGGSNAGIVTPSGWSEFHVFQNFSTVMAGQGISKAVTSKAAVAISWDHTVAGGVDWAAMVISVRKAEAAHYPTVRNTQMAVEALTTGPSVLRNTLSSIEVLITP